MGWLILWFALLIGLPIWAVRSESIYSKIKRKRRASTPPEQWPTWDAREETKPEAYEVWELSSAPQYRPHQGVVSVTRHSSRQEAESQAAAGNIAHGNEAPFPRTYQVRKASR